ncbi:uncharacterized protein LOC116350902 [Contarinia nasturtii]|uniref:uncharacterized protein LOC116350902 n=1 Tax=Contarinia nasturtii TaxID=265458 RepID=UPI0012D389C3|nr:uncharacterized protein LOC116350902 [Contarinia nasturtii]XP_031638751.1 uncharacterized protein LOC116350902 [Contarinia nasturtii]XP_031638752.1 uncharacterized protein LOC116350902 [Contarinia nasturtii]XP_031638753.1 uncharacterized protein LOC116350902 [Contarinia nasturtii]XP_031638754.1 uncharacterized protein LOC116350902 [Contarinia nasturtii]XP_031638755.1 uncharacterized protein LOC116350902 [Contarinia nasturtii]XP_031638756.1 uncharacterized protein LOC116350902 [Contarinia n
MDLVVPTELEELISCSYCHQPFNETDSLPKFLSCRHHFCLKCVNAIVQKRGELFCVHCWKTTESPTPDIKPENLPTNTAVLYLTQNLSMLNMKPKAPDKQSVSQSQSQQQLTPPPNSLQSNNIIKKGENCHTHAMPNSLWCLKCHTTICRACAGGDEHRNHTVKSHNEAKETMRSEIANELMSMQKTLVEVQHLVLKQRDFLLKILEASTSLKTQIETELINHIPTLEIAEMRESLGKAKLCMSMLDQQSPSDAYKLYSTMHLEKQRLQSKYQELYLQCKLDDVIRQYGSLFDFDLIKQALAGLQSNGDSMNALASNGLAHNNSILLLANYCISQLYSRHVLTNKHVQMMNNGGASNGNYSISPQLLNNSSQEHKTFAEIAGSPKPVSNFSGHLPDAIGSHPSPNTQQQSSQQNQAPGSGSLRHTPSSYLSDMNGISVPMTMIQHLQHSSQQQLTVGSSLGQSPQAASLICNPSVQYPIYYFNIEINGSPCGRILIEVRSDVAPKMAKNFSALALGELGFGYKGCQIFQCWENESIITGDFELNNGRGGRSVFEEAYFMPDDTKIMAIRGSVGMRRSQKRHDNMGLVGSQFRIILREMRGFTGIFGYVVEGLELVEKISQTGDTAGKPKSNVIISSCGKFQ